MFIHSPRVSNEVLVVLRLMLLVVLVEMHVEKAPVSSSSIFLDQPSSVVIVNPCCRSPRLRVRGSKPIKLSYV